MNKIELNAVKQSSEKNLREHGYLAPVALIETPIESKILALNPKVGLSDDGLKELAQYCRNEMAHTVTILADTNRYIAPKNTSEYEIHMMAENGVLDDVLKKREAYVIISLTKDSILSYSRFYKRTDAGIEFEEDETKDSGIHLGELENLRSALV